MAEQWGCVGCGGSCEEVGGLVKRPDGWKCDPCDQWEKELADVDLEEWDEKRRQRLAEQQEY
jgi:hypothetical protein